ncbi:MAG: OmpL47-type beta-barrel domain-containing protein [Brevinema sp.]
MKKQWLIAAVLMMAVQTYAQDQTTEPVAAQDLTNATETNAGSTIVEANADSMTVENVGYTITQDDVFFASPFARFKVEGVDEQSGVKDIFVSVDGSAYNPYKGAISFDKEGEHSISYKFVDHVGNVSYSKTYDIVVDATAPRILDIQFSPKPYISSGYTFVGPNAQISFRHHDDTTGVAYVEFATNENASFERFRNNVTFAQLGVSNTTLMTLRYRALDMVSNISPIKSTAVFVDATAPTVSIFADKVFERDGIRYISSKSTISVTAVDAETAVEKVLFAVNDSEFQEYDDAIGIQLKKAGNYDVKVKAMDVVGNESAEVVYSVVVDMLAPTGEVSYLGDQESSNYDQASVLGTQTAPISQYDAAPTYTPEVAVEPTTSSEVPAGMDAPVTQ